MQPSFTRPSMPSILHATRGDRRGTTLVELLAALALLGLLFGGARSLLSHLGDSNERLASEAQRGDARGTGERVLRALLRRATAGADSAHRFIADQTHAEFDSACDTES